MTLRHYWLLLRVFRLILRVSQYGVYIVINNALYGRINAPWWHGEAYPTPFVIHCGRYPPRGESVPPLYPSYFFKTLNTFPLFFWSCLLFCVEASLFFSGSCDRFTPDSR